MFYMLMGIIPQRWTNNDVGGEHKSEDLQWVREGTHCMNGVIGLETEHKLTGIQKHVRS